METQSFFIDDWKVEPELGQISNQLKTIRLEPQVMKVLAVLASQHGDVVSKQEIIDAVWQRRYTSDAALARCIFTIRRALDDDPKQPRFIQTIPKIGYKLVAEVTNAGAVAPRKKIRAWAAAAAVFCIVGVLALSYSDTEPSIVIPNTVVDTVGVGQDALFLHSLANVLGAKLRKDMSTAGVRVIETADGSSETDDGERAARSKLNSRIHVEGSAVSIEFSISDDSIFGDTWQRRFSMSTSDNLERVADIVKEVIHELDLPESPADQSIRPLPRTSSIVAYDLYLQGVKRYRDFSIAGNLSAIALFESALAHDRNFGLAYAGLSAALTMQVQFWRGGRKADALNAAMQAIELEPDRAESHYALGLALSIDFAESKRALESLAKALAIDPAHIDSLRASAALFQHNGELEKAKDYYARALSLDQNDHYTMKKLGSTYFAMGEFDNAHHWLVKSYKGQPFSVSANAQLATLDLMNGATDKAISRCDQIAQLKLKSYSCMRVAAAAAIVAGDMQDAGIRFDAMSQIWPIDGYARLGQAYILLTEDKTEQAQEIIDSVLELAHKSIEAIEADESIATKDYSLRALRAIAIGHSLMGQTAKAYEVLKSATKEGQVYDPWDEVDPLLASLRQDHRFDLYIAATKPLYR